MNTSSLLPSAAAVVEQQTVDRVDLLVDTSSKISLLRSRVESELKAVNTLVLEQLNSDIALIRQIGVHLVHSGGKQLRPITVLLSARACGYSSGSAHITLAAVIEFIHTATLLHDDVVDASSLRRGETTANQLWGNPASVLVGDFLYSRAFEMMVSAGRMEVMDIMAHTTNTIAEGEVMQLLNCYVADVTEDQYIEVIHRKTAQLFSAAAELGAVLGQQPPAIRQALAAYGTHLGTAFQLIDDLLDYRGDTTELGKNTGDDLEEGKPTLPLIYALLKGSVKQQNLIRQAIEQGGRERIEEVLEIVESTGALAYTSHLAREQIKAAKQALTVLPHSTYSTGLMDLADLAVERSF